MDAPQNSRRRRAEAGCVKMKHSGNNADNQDRETPPPLETSHETALRKPKAKARVSGTSNK